MMYISDKQYILYNYKILQFECTGKVKLVRDYLEKECGFKHANWQTEAYEWLNWLNINKFDNTVHGSEKPDDTKIKCNIDYLIGISTSDIEMCKPINLKE